MRFAPSSTSWSRWGSELCAYFDVARDDVHADQLDELRLARFAPVVGALIHVPRAAAAAVGGV